MCTQPQILRWSCLIPLVFGVVLTACTALEAVPISATSTVLGVSMDVEVHAREVTIDVENATDSSLEVSWYDSAWQADDALVDRLIPLDPSTGVPRSALKRERVPAWSQQRFYAAPSRAIDWVNEVSHIPMGAEGSRVVVHLPFIWNAQWHALETTLEFVPAGDTPRGTDFTTRVIVCEGEVRDRTVDAAP